jgi:hypothetical protein
MIAQHGTSNARNFGLRRRAFDPRRLLISAQASQRVQGDLRLACGDLPYQFEKQRKRSRCAFMLQRTMLR